jgi:AcrR family transcriptional regulator
MLPMSTAGVAGAGIPGSAAWWRDREYREARRRPRADGLSIERIVDAALAVVDTEGLDALTVRRLADDLATGSASLYRHVASRDELLVLLVDHVLGEIRMPPDDLDGRAKVEWLSHGLRGVLLDHAHLLPALTASPLLGPNAVRGAERALASFLEAGFELPAAVPACLAMIDYVLGTVYFDTSGAGRERRGGGLFVAVLDGSGAALPPSVDEVFAFGLATFLDGLEHRFPPAR